MFLKYVQIVNFRNLKGAKFCFAEGANTIIGENDAGKSNAVTAMRILLDSNYYYNTKRLKDTDFAFDLGDWKGHWIIISAFFDKITPTDKETEVCSEMIPDTENSDFLKSFIRCRGFDYGVVTLFIRPNKKIRLALHGVADKEEFERIRNEIKISDYEFVYTSRSQADFTSPGIYNTIVGDMENGIYADPENMDASLLGTKIEILDVWSYISRVFVDALRNVAAELRKPKNPIRRIVDVIQADLVYESAAAQSSNVFIPAQITGVNTKSTNQEAALEFVKEFLSSECQSELSVSDRGYPINKTAFQIMEEDVLGADDIGETSWGVSAEDLRNLFDQIEAMIPELSNRSVTDAVITDSVKEEGLKYLSGEAYLDTVVSSIMQTVTLHLAE